jgi:glycyl-tRNA synthetase
MEKQSVDKLSNLAARRSLIIPSSSAYGEMVGFYDYGPVGIRIRHNIESLWRAIFIERLGNSELDTTIIAPEKVFEASGHLKKFTDPIAVCAKCGYSHRADKVLEALFNKRGDKAKADGIKALPIQELERLMRENKVKCEKCGTELPKVETFNLMFGTKIGPLKEIQGYFRPETAQGIFLDFKEVFRNCGLKLPVGIGQAGKAFRNEISPRQGLIRMREFSQMELEYFFDPEEDKLVIGDEQVDEAALMKVKLMMLTREQQKANEEAKEMTIEKALKDGVIPNKLFAYLLTLEMEFLLSLGYPKEAIRFRQVLLEELPHYSKGNMDCEVRFGDGFEEIAGNAYRTNFDLSNHQEYSKTDMSIVNNEKKLVPHVVELSFGWDRLFWTLLANSLYFDDKRGWDVLLLSEKSAPYRYAVFPLQKDEKLMKKAMELKHRLSDMGVSAYYSHTGSIGKRYARADEVGVLRAITIDYQTLEDDTVTVRDVKDATQVRKKTSEIR